MKNICKLSLGAMMALGISSVAVGQTPTPPSPAAAPTPAADSVASRSASAVTSPARRALRNRMTAPVQRAQQAQRVQRVQSQERVRRAAAAQRMQRVQPQRMQLHRVQPQRVQRSQQLARVQRTQRQEVQRMRMQQRTQRLRVNGPQRGQGRGDAVRMTRPGRPMAIQRSQLSPRRVGPDVGRSDLLRGMTLSADQTSQLRAIRERSRARTVELRQQLRPGNTAGVRPDSAQRAAMRARLQTVSEQVAAARQQELAEVRAVLTPEQQKTFDTNRERVAERGAARRERAGRSGRSPGQPL